MIFVTRPAAIRNAYRYWFRPAKYSPTYETDAGVITMPNESGSYSVVVSSQTQTILAPSTGTFVLYDSPGWKVGWCIKIEADTVGSGRYMLARITALDADPVDPLQVTMTYDAYEAAGNGTADYWHITSQFEQAWNFIQNPEYSAKELSARIYAYQYSQWLFPFDREYTDYVTADTPTFKSGYTECDYKGQITVQEDEYDYNRPYVGVTVSASCSVTQTTTVTTIDYTTTPPTVTTVTTEVTATPLSHSYTFVESDFNPSGAGYVPGNPAVYADGELITYPSPGQSTRTLPLGGNYVSQTYEYFYENYAPPGDPPLYRETQTIVMDVTVGPMVANPISPPDFF